MAQRCSLIKNSIALDAELCLCAIVKVNTLGLVDVDATAQLELLLNACGLHPTRTYIC
ncbi:hypothetical protein PVK06_045539 [Gossypium arboreum]|uniref:Hydrophobic seed protein domain-containing protein n=2 Tax=Gossypium TaxID=3633 RepID=A0ABR0MWF5_GOSAR|nr:hypothetical protein PVK06_045539 [Gossypium arboreum]